METKIIFKMSVTTGVLDSGFCCIVITHFEVAFKENIHVICLLIFKCWKTYIHNLLYIFYFECSMFCNITAKTKQQKQGILSM